MLCNTSKFNNYHYHCEQYLTLLLPFLCEQNQSIEGEYKSNACK